MAKFTGHTITPDSALGGIEIEKSLRFEESDNTYLSASPTFNTKKYTFSVWVKPVKKGGGCLLGYNSVGNNRQTFSYGDYEGVWANQLRKGGSTQSQYDTIAYFRDMTSWYHVVYVWDTDNGTQADRFIVYVNNVRQSMNQYTGTSSGVTGYIGDGSTINIGKSTDGYSKARFYLADYHLIDGQAYDASYFGFTDAQTGQWRPKKYTGSYGSGGFHLEFKDTSNLGKDTSGNANNWTANNFSVSAGYGNDSLEDTPTNNFCVMNGEGDNDNITCTNGGLQLTQANTSVGCRIRGTHAMPPNTGKYYYEMEIQTGASYNFGMKGIERLGSHTSGNDGRISYYGYNGNKSDESGASSYGASYVAGDTVAILYDSDSGEVYFYKNGTSQGLAFTGVNDRTYLPFVYLDNYGTNPVVHMNFGQRPFKYTQPTGSQKLSSKNLATPVPAGIVKPQRHFGVLSWSGNDGSQTIDGLEFTPDFVWVKARRSGEHHFFTDIIRGAGHRLQSSSQAVESDRSSEFTSFVRGGFTIAGTHNEINGGGVNIIGMCWKAGGAAVANSDGSIASQVSANQEAGFSIVTWTGNATSGATVGHGLGEAPACIFLKGRNFEDHWAVYHKGIGTSLSDSNRKLIKLNDEGVYQTSTGYWNDTSPTSSVFSLGNDQRTNKNTGTFVAYCWTEIPGYSKFGGYTGNGSTHGTYVSLGFRPAFLVIRRTDSGNNWRTFDSTRSTYNEVDKRLYLDTNNDESTGSDIDFLSDGFKLRNTDNGMNTSSGTYLYMAWAEEPGTTPFDTFPNAR